VSNESRDVRRNMIYIRSGLLLEQMTQLEIALEEEECRDKMMYLNVDIVKKVLCAS